jgi:hypothetical protein
MKTLFFLWTLWWGVVSFLLFKTLEVPSWFACLEGIFFGSVYVGVISLTYNDLKK